MRLCWGLARLGNLPRLGVLYPKFVWPMLHPFLHYTANSSALLLTVYIAYSPGASLWSDRKSPLIVFLYGGHMCLLLKAVQTAKNVLLLETFFWIWRSFDVCSLFLGGSVRTHIYLVAMESVVLSARPSSTDLKCILRCICSQTLTEKHLILEFCED